MSGNLGGPLSEQVERIRRKAHEAGRIAPGPDDGEDPEELAVARARGIDAARVYRWERVVPRKFRNASLTYFVDRPFFDDLAGWAERVGQHRNLVLLGPVGVGKTGAALTACRSAHDRGMEVVYRMAAEALDELRPDGDPDALDLFSECDRLILDDLGSERRTDWTAERFDIVIHRREREELPTIITANLEIDPDDRRNTLLQAVGPRSYSRLVGDDALILRLSGADRRRTP